MRIIIDDFLEPENRDNLFYFITSPHFPYFLTDQYTNILPDSHPEYKYNPKEWRIGGVPVLAMLRSQPKAGYHRNELVVPS